jgi:formylglycine-generating enzyme required for sulfatase activity
MVVVVKIETPPLKRRGPTFAIAAHEVTVAEFCRFRKSHGYNATYSPSDDHPVNRVTWYDAAAYCNWLSYQEDIPPEQWCYESKNGKDVRDWSQKAYGEGMKLRANYLSLEGYRLPSEAEWELACRAGSVTARYFGQTEELMGRYAWYAKNSQDRWMLPVGTLKPNELGLFDLLGNAIEWCQDSSMLYQLGIRHREDKEDPRYVGDASTRILRGGSFLGRAIDVRSAHRFGNVPALRGIFIGFRPARTIR